MSVWRARASRWFEPLARRCPLSPDAVTVIAALLCWGAAAALWFAPRDPRLFPVAVLLVLVGGIADAFDGIVARVQGKESRFGDFLDHFLDRVSDTLLTIGWVEGTGVRAPLAYAAVAAVFWTGYAGTQLEATFQRREYESVGRAEFVIALIAFPLIVWGATAGGWSATRFGGLTCAEWLTLLLTLLASVSIVQRVLEARRMESR